MMYHATLHVGLQIEAIHSGAAVHGDGPRLASSPLPAGILAVWHACIQVPPVGRVVCYICSPAASGAQAVADFPVGRTRQQLDLSCTGGTRCVGTVGGGGLGLGGVLLLAGRADRSTAPHVLPLCSSGVQFSYFWVENQEAFELLFWGVHPKMDPPRSPLHLLALVLFRPMHESCCGVAPLRRCSSLVFLPSSLHLCLTMHTASQSTWVCTP
jgi:hypothetical protein